MSRWWEGGSAVTGVGRIAGYILEKYRGLAALSTGARSRGTGSQQMVVRQMPRFSDEIKLAEQRARQPSRPVRDSCSTKKERLVEYTIKPGDTLWALANKKFHVHLEDLIKENGITDPRNIQPGQRIQVALPIYSTQEKEVVASWYGHEHHGKPMANGEPFNMYSSTIAHKELPLGTKVELRNPDTGVKVRAVVADRGPYVRGRDVDLSYGLARRLALVDRGVGRLMMRVIG